MSCIHTVVESMYRWAVRMFWQHWNQIVGWKTTQTNPQSLKGIQKTILPQTDTKLIYH